MADDETVETTDTPPTDDDAQLVAEVEELTRPAAEKDQDRVKHALIAAKRELRTANRRVKELEPIAQRATEIGTQLDSAMPIINAVTQNPRLLAEALRISKGTRTSTEMTDQPDDADLTAFAEDSGWYLADGTTPDAARAQRVLTRLDARHGKQTDDRIRPLASVTLGGRAEANVIAALKAVDEDGVPYATKESIDEVARELPRELLADPRVANMILTQAIGIDRLKRRTPKAQDEPIYLDRQSGGGRPREAALSPFERKHIESSGLSEKEYRASVAKMGTGRAIELGKG